MFLETTQAVLSLARRDVGGANEHLRPCGLTLRTIFGL